MKKLLIVNVTDEKESEIENLKEIFIKDEWNFEEIDFNKVPYQTDKARREIFFQNKVEKFEDEIADIKSRNESRELDLKGQLLDALETAVECTSNQFSFGNASIDMRDRIIELRKDLNIVPTIHISVDDEMFKITPEIEELIIEKVFDNLRFKA